MRVLIVDTCYPAFLGSHYRANPGLEHRTYDEQWRSLMDTFFGTADSYSHYLRELGHEAHEVVVNAEPLQRAWAREHGARPGLGRRLLRRSDSDSFSRKPIVRARRRLRPAIGFLPPRTMAALKARARLLVGQIASEAPAAEHFRHLDLVLTSFPHFVPRFRGEGIASEYLRIGFDPRVLDRLGPSEPSHDTVFVGALGRLQHARGNELLERAAERVPIDFWGYNLGDRPPSSPLVRRYHGEAWGIDMLRVLAGARIAVNRHIDVAEEYANNMRLYEATGVGSLLLTDAKQNLAELFEVGSEVIAYPRRGRARGGDRALPRGRRRTCRRRRGARRGRSVDHSYAVQHSASSNDPDSFPP